MNVRQGKGLLDETFRGQVLASNISCRLATDLNATVEFLKAFESEGLNYRL
ncbi:hypothetical protein D9M69_655010 [compost metagenome]